LTTSGDASYSGVASGISIIDNVRLITMEATIYIRSRYLDASAAVKLVVSEVGSDVVQKCFEGGGPFYITSICVAEVLSILKVKYLYRKELTQEQYLAVVYFFLSLLRGPLHVEDVGLENHQVLFETEELAKCHGLDIVDALQLFTLKHGRFSNFVGPSKSLLITADEALAKAARSEGLEVWDCMHEVAP
jgi:predicted nucleic acid-binding protein